MLAAPRRSFSRQLRLEEWNYAIQQTSKTSPGPVGVGTTYRQVRSIPSRSEEGFQVTAFESTSRLEVHGEIGPFTATPELPAHPPGEGTRPVNSVDLQPASGALRLLAPLATSRVKMAVAANSTRSSSCWRLSRRNAPRSGGGQSVPRNRRRPAWFIPDRPDHPGGDLRVGQHPVGARGRRPARPQRVHLPAPDRARQRLMC